VQFEWIKDHAPALESFVRSLDMLRQKYRPALQREGAGISNCCSLLASSLALQPK
jgi:hypothetical protein